MKNSFWLLAAVCSVSFSARAADTEPSAPRRPVEGIMDNSFLVEEAYNQEPGVVQHIFTTFYSVTRSAGHDEHAWASAFTQEWPIFSQRHHVGRWRASWTTRFWWKKPTTRNPAWCSTSSPETSCP